MKKRESLPAEDKDTKNEETKGEGGEQESGDPKEEEESRESKDVKKEETCQGVIEGAEGGDIGEQKQKKEIGKNILQKVKTRSKQKNFRMVKI